MSGPTDLAKGAARELDRRARRKQPLEGRCTAIADIAIPAYRSGKQSYSCTGHMAKRWQAAWDGACIALGGSPKDFRR